MLEETVTISVSDLMNFPPTFGGTFEEVRKAKSIKERIFEHLKKFNPFHNMFEESQKALLKEFFSKANDPFCPAEVLIFAKNDTVSDEISHLIRSSMMR